jgi:hypothetical protein
MKVVFSRARGCVLFLNTLIDRSRRFLLFERNKWRAAGLLVRHRLATNSCVEARGTSLVVFWNKGIKDN